MAVLNYYAVLDVALQATQEDIKKAYRKLALQYHPDRNQGDRQAEQKIRKINEAYEILGDPQARKTYDRLRLGHAPVTQRHEEEPEETVSPGVVLQRMEQTLEEESRKQIFMVLMKNTEIIKAELVRIREKVIQAQGYDTFLDSVVRNCARERLPSLVTEELLQLRERLVDIAVEMVCSEVPGAFQEGDGIDQVRQTLQQSYQEGWIQGYAQACGLLYERR